MRRWHWPAAPDRTRPPAPNGWVDCWAVELGLLPAEAESVALSLLSAHESDRANRFHFDRHRWRYIASHAALRLLIERYTTIPAHEVVIVAEPTGRPVLGHPASGPHFNLSHSGAVAIVAISFAAPVGVDVEKVRPVPDFADLAHRYFAVREVERLLALPQKRRLDGFFATWTRKEAFVKALGLGLSYPLDAFDTGPPDRSPSLTRANGVAYTDWTLSELRPASGVIGALAIGLPQIGLRCRRAKWSWLLDGLPSAL